MNALSASLVAHTQNPHMRKKSGMWVVEHRMY
jgi:hypothetical protein